MSTDLTVGHLVQALALRDRAGLLARLSDEVVLKALLPRRYVERDGAAEVADEMLGWFEDVPEIVVRHCQVDRVGDVWHAGFQFGLLGLTPEHVVEQHAYCVVADGTVTTIRVLCSGFRPVDVEPRPDRVVDGLGDGCATLTPRIAAAMRELATGDVLAVLTDDPAAPDDLGAWSRLTGHDIVATAGEPHGTRFYLRHA
jgi:TusA-related sulfurtransferase